MKKINKILLLLLMMSAFAGFSQKKKVAIVTFYANKVIDFSEIAGDKLTESVAKKVFDLRDNPKFNLEPILNKYHDAFVNEYAKSFPFDLLPESEVTTSAAYKSFVPKYQMDKFQALDFLVYNGYKYIYDGPLGAPNEEGIAKALADKADGVMFVYINFAFEKGFGIGGTSTLKVKAFTRISLYNKKGEELFVINENERSKKTMMMVGGVPVLDVDKILPNCESALTELMGDLNKRIEKIVKKTTLKL
jgi:hypothetical protein